MRENQTPHVRIYLFFGVLTIMHFLTCEATTNISTTRAPVLSMFLCSCYALSSALPRINVGRVFPSSSTHRLSCVHSLSQRSKQHEQNWCDHCLTFYLTVYFVFVESSQNKRTASIERMQIEPVANHPADR